MLKHDNRWMGLALTLVLRMVALASAGEQVHLLRTPEGGLQPQALMDGSGTLHLVYLKGEPAACDVFYVRRAPGQTNFSSPLRVNSRPRSAVAMGTVRGAQMAVGRDRRIHVAWNGSASANAGHGEGEPMFYTRLNDAGDGFEPERNLMTSTTHLDGGGSVAADALGNVYVAWHGHAKSGPQDEQHRGVFVARSRDDGKTFTPEIQADRPRVGACSCCGLKAMTDHRGRLAILYRSANAERSRDATLLVSKDHGASFDSKVLGSWRVPMCPMSTHALAQGPGDALLALWETQGQIYHELVSPERMSSAAAGLATEGSGGRCKHPAVAVSLSKAGGRLLMVWTENTAWAKGGSLAWEWIDLQTGEKGSGRAGGVPAWSFAAAVAERDGSFAIIY
jgi:hypothetical protein